MEKVQKTRQILKRIDINKILLQNSNSTICPVKIGRGRNLDHKKDILGRLLRKCVQKGFSRELEIAWKFLIQMSKDDQQNKEIQSKIKIYLLEIFEGKTFSSFQSIYQAPIHLAIIRNDVILAKFITKNLSTTKSLTNHLVAPRSEDFVPMAISRKFYEILDILAPKVDNPNLPNARNGWTPFQEAALRGNKEIVKILAPLIVDINEANPNTRQTPLQDAAANGHTEIVKIIAPLVKSASRIKMLQGCTPIELAMQKGHKEVLVILANSDFVDRKEQINALMYILK